jgi:transglutaminase-like putative cysteine protease
VWTFPDAVTARYRDAFDNEVIWFQIHQPHERLVVEAQALVTRRRSQRAGREALEAVDWELVETDDYRDAQAEFLAPSTFVHWGPVIEQFGAELAIAASRPGLWLVELEYALAESIAYSPGFTSVDTPIERVIEIRRGVCQDLAQVFIALARHRGIATRYVSGWLYRPGANTPGESHAWAEALLPGIGWVAFDPTHPDPNLSHFVRIGVGRDYADVPPVKGSYVGPAAEQMTVAVSVEPGEEPA